MSHLTLPWCWRPCDGASDADPPPVLVQLPLLLVEVRPLGVDVADQLLVTLVYYLKWEISIINQLSIVIGLVSKFHMNTRSLFDRLRSSVERREIASS